MNKIARFSGICAADAVSLSALYEATSERTLAAWQQVPDCGEVMQNAHYDPHRLALATGIQPPLSGAIASLRQKLAALTGDDPLAGCMPASGLHFTFLPVTLPLYEKGQRPQELDALRALWQAWDGQTTRIRGLRLVALPGQLLLAGIPDEASQRARQTFCETLLSSPWRGIKPRRCHRHSGTQPCYDIGHNAYLCRYAVFLSRNVTGAMATLQARSYSAWSTTTGRG